MFFVYKSRCSGKVRTLPKEQHHVFISGLNEPRYRGVDFCGGACDSTMSYKFSSCALCPRSSRQLSLSFLHRTRLHFDSRQHPYARVRGSFPSLVLAHGASISFSSVSVSDYAACTSAAAAAASPASASASATTPLAHQQRQLQH